MTPHPRAPRQVDRRGRSARLLLAAPLAVLTLAVGACAPSSDASSGSTADGGQTLTVWSWRTEDVDAYNQIFDVFEKAHPGVTVNFRAFKNTEYNQVLTTGLTGSGGPDVAQVRSYGQLQPTIASQALVPLDGKVDLNSWDPTVVASAKGKADGKIYSVPLARQTIQMFYNKALFEQHNLKPPTTWDEFLAVNKTLKDAGVTPLAVGAKDAWTLPIVHEALAAPRFGAGQFAKDVVSGATTFTDPNWVASVQVLADLKSYLPDNAVGVAYTDAQVLFTSGQAAMFPGGSFELGFFQKQNPQLQIGTFEVPAPTGSPSSATTTPTYADGAFAVSAKGGQQDLAMQLVQWTATPEFGQLVADTLKQISAVPGVTPSDPLLAEMAKRGESNGSPYLLVTDFRYGTPTGTDVFGAGVQELLLGKKNAAQVSQDLQTGLSAWFTPAGSGGSPSPGSGGASSGAATQG